MSTIKRANTKKNMFGMLIRLAVIVLFASATSQANAQAVQDTIDITPATYGCGASDLTFSGTAGYISNIPHRIIVKLDGVEIYTNDSKPTNWTTSPAVAVSVGSHTLHVELWDLDQNNNLDTIDDEDTWQFTIDACATPTPTVTPTATPTPDGTGGAGDEKDCCPGKDPEPETTSNGKVLGTTTKKATPTPTPKVAGTTTFKAPATGISVLPSLVVALVSTGLAIQVGKNQK